jgi:hypothetical protein
LDGDFLVKRWGEADGIGKLLVIDLEPISCKVMRAFELDDHA